MNDRQSLLREALSLDPEDDILETDSSDTFIVERMRVPGVAGFCSSIPTEEMEVYRVVKEGEEAEGTLLTTIYGMSVYKI